MNWGNPPAYNQCWLQNVSMQAECASLRKTENTTTTVPPIFQIYTPTHHGQTSSIFAGTFSWVKDQYNNPSFPNIQFLSLTIKKVHER